MFSLSIEALPRLACTNRYGEDDEETCPDGFAAYAQLAWISSINPNRGSNLLKEKTQP